MKASGRTVPLAGVIIWAFTGIGLLHAAAGQRETTTQVLRQACQFFATRVATEGGYLWEYSDDLQRREGEEVAPATAVWVQPPGTPAVGMAFLHAYAATKDPYYLELAKKVGTCLRRGQLRSGGWDYRIDFDPQLRKKHAYRSDGAATTAKQANVTTLDDDTTQSALSFLIHLDKTLDFKDHDLHEVVEYGLGKLLTVQYPIGAWPQRFVDPPDPARFPVKKASYPETWSRTYPGIKYAEFYTFNDNAISDTVGLMFLAAHVYNQPRYREAAEKCGQFILLAQMPEPQPAWAQQYDAEMHPAWARKFEPASVTGGESKGVMQTLLRFYQETGDRKYLEPIPRALAYLKKSALPDGRLARFYELQSNRPLYFTKDYKLTYQDDDMPTHYSFKVSNELDKIEAQYRRLAQTTAAKLKARRDPTDWRPGKATAADVERIVAALDAQGRWLESGPLKKDKLTPPASKIISCATFIRNVNALSDFLIQ